MDPYKVLGVARNAELQEVREQAMKLKKKYKARRDKKGLAAMYAAWEAVQSDKLQTRQIQLLGRSRKERELDGAFRRQGREIHKEGSLDPRAPDQDIEEIRLPGDRVQIPQHSREYILKQKKRQREIRESRRRRRMGLRVKKQPKHVDALTRLKRMHVFLLDPIKFPKAVQIIRREIVPAALDPDSKDDFIDAFDAILRCGNVTCDDGRDEVLKLFERLPQHFKHCFQTESDERYLRVWNVAAVIPNRIKKADGLTLGEEVRKLREIFEGFENTRELNRVFCFPKLDGTEDLNTEFMPLPSPGSAVDGCPEPRPISSAVDTLPLASPESAEPCSSTPLTSPCELPDRSPLSSSCDHDDDMGLKLEVKTEVKVEHVKSERQEEVLDVSMQPLDNDFSDAEDAQSLSRAFLDEERFHVLMRRYFVIALEYVFALRNKPWARGQVVSLFQDVYYSRSRLFDEEAERVSQMQADLKVVQKTKDLTKVLALDPLEANRPVVDGREETAFTNSASQGWMMKNFGLIEM
mmetsp:Transcript_41239/g.89921  ORF Transcript_41239/g.89921 Transcript_41239/m.89921 type:complete len:522 (+) Transcript_41239:21-1586(+)